jgi:hypothetical protein
MEKHMQEYIAIMSEMPEVRETLMLAKTVCMLNSFWFDDWSDFAETGSDRPGSIDNSCLLTAPSSEFYQIRPDREEDV